jgi:transcriptional regulator GlxA family with amidase domain
MLAYAEAEVLDIVGPVDVFSIAARLLALQSSVKNAYSVEIAAPDSSPIATSSGVRLLPDIAMNKIAGNIDTLLVAGGQGAIRASQDPSIVKCVRKAAAHVRRLCSVCTGAFILAEAGLLDGRSATTHWRSCQLLAERYPSITVHKDPIFVRDANVFTSAGVTAGIDLALALVEEDFGRAIALEVARNMVMFLKRPGGQSQYSTQMSIQAADRQPIRELQTWIGDHLEQDLSVELLAERARMSPRNFARVFRRETGITPGLFVEVSRVEAARRRLEESTDGVDLIASICGFGTRESMRRAFLRVLRVSPRAYRERFRVREPGWPGQLVQPAQPYPPRKGRPGSNAPVVKANGTA